MLTRFSLRFQFYEMRVSVHVDRDTKESDATVTWNGRIVRQAPLPFHEVSTPEKARAYWSRPVNEYGNAIESLHASLRRECSVVPTCQPQPILPLYKEPA